MINVPRREQGVIATQPLPNFRHTADEFSAANPIDLSGLTRELGQVFERERQKANQVAVLDADNQLSDTVIALQSEALNRQGKDVLDALPKAQEQWKEKASTIEGSLSNDDQRLAFRRMAIGRWDSLHETIARHTDAEMQKYDATTTDAAVKNRLNDALANYMDPAAVEHAIAETRAIITDFGKRHGASPELLAQQNAAAVSRVHAGVIDRMLANGADLAASKYYATAKKEISGVDAADLEKALEEGSVRGESQRQADQIVAQKATRTTALEAARKITDPKVRDAVENRVNQFFAEKGQAEQETREANMLTATNIIDKTASIYRVPPALWTTLTLGERASLKAYAKQKASGEDIETNWTTYYDLLSLASTSETRNGFISKNLLQYRGQLGNTEFKQVMELQANLRSGDSKAESKLAGIRTAQQIIGQTLKQAGINPNPKPGSDDADRVALFSRAVDEQALIFEEENKRRPNSKELQSIVDNLVVQGTIAGTGLLGFFQRKKREFERLPGEGDFIVHVRDVPPAERLKIEDALRRSKQPVTDANVLRLYQAKLSTLVPSASQ